MTRRMEWIRPLSNTETKIFQLEVERDTYKNALEILAKAEPVGTHGKMTLTELV